jgi:hypothetical protein
MRNSIITILLLAILICSCGSNDDEDAPPPNLPPTIYGQLPTRSAIIQAAEAVGATNVQIISYQIATGSAGNFTGGVTTNGGFQPNWWRADQSWGNSSFIPTIIGVSVVYDKTSKMHTNVSVKGAIYRLLESAGFEDATWGWGVLEVEATTDNGMRLIPLPTHARIINEVEQLGASNVRINIYVVSTVDFWPPPPIDLPGSPFTLYRMHIVPADSNYNTVQGDGYTRMLRLSYEHPGLGSIITNNDVESTIRALFIQYGFKSVDVITTGTKVSSSFPLPSFIQIRQAAEQAGASSVQVSTYKANNVDVIPMNEGSRLPDMPVIVEINYGGAIIPAVKTNIMALFANFTNVHIGNNATATIPLPTSSNIRIAVINVLYFPESNEPSVYTVDGTGVWIYEPGNAPWNARIRVVVNGDGSNTPADAANAVQALIRLFNERGFFNLDISVSNR